MTWTAIAAEFNAGRDAVADLARKYNIPIRHCDKVDPDNLDRLYEQHVVKERTLTDIAQDIGVSISGLSRAAKKCDIPVCRDPRKAGLIFSACIKVVFALRDQLPDHHRVESRRAAVGSLQITRRCVAAQSLTTVESSPVGLRCPMKAPFAEGR